MRILIHDRPGSFSDRWIDYCRLNGFKHQLVHCGDNRIIQMLRDDDILLWHFGMLGDSTYGTAKSIIRAIEGTGVQVYPNSKTCWHFDDKLAQKYLLESVGAPLVNTYVMYDRVVALDWIKNTQFPKVWKLSKGAGASNVRLIKSSQQAKAVCAKAFGRGFVATPSYFGDASTKLRKTKGLSNFLSKLGRAPKLLSKIMQNRKCLPLERGYLYFQDYLPGNTYDTRVTVIGGRAFGFVRHNRPGDFRASGSGLIEDDPGKVDMECVRIAFDVSAKLEFQSMAFDFIYDEERRPRIVEISFCFGRKFFEKCPGYWDRNLVWHEGHVWPQDAILQDLLSSAYTVSTS